MDDPRYAALVRETADYHVRNGWMLLFFSVLITIQLAQVVARLVRGADWATTVAIAVAALLMAFGLGVIWVARQRSKQYLDKAGAHQRPQDER